MKKNCGVYQIQNKITGRVYIGGTKDFSKRKLAHFSKLKKNKHENINLQIDYNLYKKSKFIFEILEICEENILREREQYYLDTLMPYLPLFGYNKAKTAAETADMEICMLANKDRKRVINITTGEVFESMNDAGRSIGVDKSDIRRVCKGERNHCHGFNFKFADKDNE